jgi:hypothetical protein
MNPWVWLKEIEQWSVAGQKNSSSPPELLHGKQSSKHPHSYFSSCRCSLLIQSMSSNSDARFNESKPLNQLWDHYVPLLRLSSHSSAHFNNMVGHEIQPTEDIFSTVHMNLQAWLNIMGLEATQCGTKLSRGNICQEVMLYTSTSTLSSRTMWLVSSVLQQTVCKTSTPWCQPQSVLHLSLVIRVNQSYGQIQYIIYTVSVCMSVLIFDM